MAVQFKMIPKQNNLVSPPDIKYYPCAVSKGEVNLDDLAKKISGRCTISKADCYGVIIALSDVIGEALSEGKIVKILNLGSFQLSLSGTAADDEISLGKANIKSARLIYRPAKVLKATIKGITYKRMR